MKNKLLIAFALNLILIQVVISSQQDRCSTLSCVHASAQILTKIDEKIDPCDDFYSYACGTFIEEQHTPDEKTTVDTIALMSDKLTEFLLTLLEQAPEGETTKLHGLARKLYNSCLDLDTILSRGKVPLENLLKEIGGWPLLIGKSWDGSKWDWKNAILKLRRYIGKYNDDIFDANKEKSNTIEGARKFSEDQEDILRVSKNFKNLIKRVAQIMQEKNSESETVDKEIDDLFDFEQKLDQFYNNFNSYRKIFEPFFKNKTSGFVKVPELAKLHKYVIYTNLLEPYILSSGVSNNVNLTIAFNVQYHKFLKNTPKRTIANFLCWRIVQTTLNFLDRDFRSLVLSFQKNAFGKEDIEQRWTYCANTATTYAPVAIGSLYISSYFSEKDKRKAEELVQYILEEYIDTIKRSSWMDENTKLKALETTSKMTKFIGYHEKLRGNEAKTYYDSIPDYDEKKFFELGLALKILTTDREYRKLHGKGGVDGEWTKYSKPATVNAFYSPKDNSIQFPAAILQSPNFDKDRPPVLNFGSIGSIIGHEITHAFDDQASRIEKWSEKSRKSYYERVQCIIDQYSSYRVQEIEEFFANNSLIHLNGILTQKENIADCGGVKLSLNAFKNFHAKYPDTNSIPIGLQKFKNEQLFWLGFAQTFCSVERPERMKNKIETDNHSLDRFRVIGALSNMPEFSEAWNCPKGSPMNPEKKCALW